MFPGDDDRRSYDDEDEDRGHDEPRGWSKPELPRSEPEPPWGIENAIPVEPANPVPQNPHEQWGGRAGSHGDDTESKPPVVQVPASATTVRSRR